MACKDKKCENCGSNLDRVPETLPESRVVYVESEGPGFWTFFWGMTIGLLFFGC